MGYRWYGEKNGDHVEYVEDEYEVGDDDYDDDLLAKFAWSTKR